MTTWNDEMVYPEGEDPRKFPNFLYVPKEPEKGGWTIAPGTSWEWTAPATITTDIDTTLIGGSSSITSSGPYTVTINVDAANATSVAKEVDWTLRNAVKF